MSDPIAAQFADAINEGVTKAVKPLADFIKPWDDIQNADGIESVFKMLEQGLFWKGYFAAFLVTLPIVLLILLIYNMKIKGIKKQLAAQRADIQMLRDHLNAANGDAEAQYNLGVCYANGWGVPKDPKQAMYWYTKAAEQGNEDAQNALMK